MFRFFLTFPDYPEWGNDGRVQISEPVKFDGSAFTVKQDEGRYGRDISYGSEEVSLEFYKGEFGLGENPTQYPDGTFTQNLTGGYEFITEAVKRFGTELVCYFEVTDDNTDFTLGILDVKTATDNKATKFSCKIVQDIQRALIKKNEDVPIDIFSDKDLFGNHITPVSTQSMFLKAKPVKQKSIWEQKEATIWAAGGSRYRAFSLFSTLYGIQNSLVPESVGTGLGDAQTAGNFFKYIRAQDDISDLTVTMDLDADFIYRVQGGSGGSLASIALFYAVFDEPFDLPAVPPTIFVSPYEKVITGNADVDFHLPEQIQFTVPFIGRDQCFSVWWGIDYGTEHLTTSNGMNQFFQGLAYSFLAYVSWLPPAVFANLITNGASQGPTYWKFNSSKITMEGTSTGIDTVVRAVWYIDAIKQVPLAINGFSVEAVDFDLGGRLHDQMVVNGSGIRQRKAPFTLKWKDDIVESLKERNYDYQVNPDGIYIGHERDFYANREIGVFVADPSSRPDADYTETFLDRHCVSSISYEYKKFEQQAIGTETNQQQPETIDGVHTQAEFHNGNKGVQNKKSISLPQVRDPFYIASLQKRNITIEKGTSTDGDDSWCLIDVVQLPPGYVNEFGKRLLIRKTNIPNQVEILNNDQDGNGYPINWEVLGLGFNFEIIGGSNAGQYAITAKTPYVLTASRLNDPDPIVTKNEIVRIRYVVNNVLWTNRTDEGFDIIEGIESPRNFSNANFGIYANLEDWEERMACWSLYNQGSSYRNQYYKNKPGIDDSGMQIPWFRTQFNLGEIYDYKADIPVSSLRDPLVTQNGIQRKLIASLSEMKELWQRMYDERGFVRVIDPNGDVNRIFLYDSSYRFLEWVCDLKGEKKYESDELTIDTLNGNVVGISQTPYDRTFLADEMYESFGNSVRLMDSRFRPLTNRYRFDKVRVNGVVYASIEELQAALDAL